ARLQTVWREIDMSLSRTDPFDFNLDLEQMFWAPFAGAPITYDAFDRLSLFVGHSEWRPEPCVGQVGALPTLPSSGLSTVFADNFAYNVTLAGAKEVSSPAPHTAFADKNLVIDASLAITEPNNVNRFLPLPKFQKPYFVWRDETQPVQGANSQVGADINDGTRRAYTAYIVSPFLAGQGRYVSTNAQGQPAFNFGAWQNSDEYWLVQRTRRDLLTGGQVGSIGLPLLADFWVYPDSPDLPVGEGFIASGSNGWQVALAVQSAPQPNFRVLSAGGRVTGGRPILMDPSNQGWSRAQGGYDPQGNRTSNGDNTVYWLMADFLKRSTVVTNGFVEILNPHRMPTTGGVIDPRLGPYFSGTQPADRLPVFNYEFEPTLDKLPGGTSVTVEFRGAGVIDKLSQVSATVFGPWRAKEDTYRTVPDEENFPLDPFKAGDAHIRKFDDRSLNGQPRNTWTYYYNRNVTEYAQDPNALMDIRFTSQFAGPNESFQPQDVKYFNWRFLMKNNVDVVPPATPSVQSFAVTYRFERTR
ncbi:MAG: hypothetical protein IT458_03795, partial [Planctomycetes bacterium]|nr:hypothetical protein [Planctomycetota bacterium]